MGWFIFRSLLVILLALVIGFIVGYWWWRRWWTKHRFSESEAVTRVTREHSEIVAAKDAEIGRLRGLLDAGAAAGGSAAVVAATHGDADASTQGDGALDADVAAEVHDAEVAQSDADSAADADAADGAGEVETSDLVDVHAVDVPSVDASGHEGGLDVDAMDAPSVDVSAAGLAGLPSQADGAHDAVETSGAGEQSVIDLTDGAVGAGDAASDAGSDVVSDVDSGEGGTIAGLAATGAAAAATGSGSGSGSDESAEDDLERIEGIGPRISGALKASGIHTFRALADSDVAALQAALEAAGLRFAPSLPTWARQARFLADGDEAGFIALTEQLVAGRDPGKGA